MKKSLNILKAFFIVALCATTSSSAIKTKQYEGLNIKTTASSTPVKFHMLECKDGLQCNYKARACSGDGYATICDNDSTVCSKGTCSVTTTTRCSIDDDCTGQGETCDLTTVPGGICEKVNKIELLVTSSGGATSLDGLTDVVIDSSGGAGTLAEGHILIFDGTLTAINRPLITSDITGLVDCTTSACNLLAGTTIDSNTAWHAGNDGNGSGLDADKLDSFGSSSFLRSDTADTMTGVLTITAHTGLKLQNENTALFGADQGSATITNETVKMYRIGSPHYLSDTELPAALIVGYNSSTSNLITIGGGSGAYNAATQIILRVAGTNTEQATTNEHNRLTIAGVNGDVTLGTHDDDNTPLLLITGDGAGSTEGGELRLYAAADYDATNEFMFMDVYQDDLRIGNNTNVHMLMTAAGAITMNAAALDADFKVKSVDNANMLYVDAGTSRVGVGTSTPASSLHVVTDDANGLLVERSTGDNSHIQFINDDDAAGFFLGLSGAEKFGISRNADLGTSAVLLTIEQTGEVGIGTNSPSANLHIKNYGDATIFLEADPDNDTETYNPTITLSQDGGLFTAFIGLEGYPGATSTDTRVNAFLVGTEKSTDLQFITTDAVRMTILSDGKVGIGTTTPSKELEVAGAIRASEPGDPTNYIELTTDGNSFGRIRSKGLGFVDNYYCSNSTITVCLSDADCQTPAGGICTTGVEYARFTNTGNLGLGTNSPGANLHIKDEFDAEIILEADTEDGLDEANNPKIKFIQDGGGIYAFIGLEGNAGVTSANTITNALLVGTEDTDVDLQFITKDRVRMSLIRDGTIHLPHDTKLDIDGSIYVGVEESITYPYQLNALTFHTTWGNPLTESSLNLGPLLTNKAVNSLFWRPIKALEYWAGTCSTSGECIESSDCPSSGTCSGQQWKSWDNLTGAKSALELFDGITASGQQLTDTGMMIDHTHRRWRVTVATIGWQRPELVMLHRPWDNGTRWPSCMVVETSGNFDSASNTCDHDNSLCDEHADCGSGNICGDIITTLGVADGATYACNNVATNVIPSSNLFVSTMLARPPPENNYLPVAYPELRYTFEWVDLTCNVAAANTTCNISAGKCNNNLKIDCTNDTECGVCTSAGTACSSVVGSYDCSSSLLEIEAYSAYSTYSGERSTGLPFWWDQDHSVFFQTDATRFLLNNGSEANPFLAFTDDLDSGMFRTAADTFGFSAGGEEALTFYGSTIVLNEDGLTRDFRIESANQPVLFKVDAANDRIGINTASPSSKVHIVGTTDTNSGTDGVLTIGPIDTFNLSLDQNEIMARNNSGISSLYLNYMGGTTGGTVNTGGNLVVFNTAPTLVLEDSEGLCTAGTNLGGICYTNYGCDTSTNSGDGVCTKSSNTSSRPELRFSNNKTAAISGDGTNSGTQYFTFTSKWSGNRDDDAIVRIYGDTKCYTGLCKDGSACDVDSDCDGFYAYTSLGHTGVHGQLQTDKGALQLHPDSGTVEVGYGGLKPHIVTIHGDLTGGGDPEKGKEGGELRLQTADDWDSTYDFFFIDAFQDNLRLGRHGATQLQLSGNDIMTVYTSSVFNDNQLDRDFRVESDFRTHMLFVDAGIETVAIGTDNPDADSLLNVKPGYILIENTENSHPVLTGDTWQHVLQLGDTYADPVATNVGTDVYVSTGGTGKLAFHTKRWGQSIHFTRSSQEYCSNSGYADKTTCEAAGHTWADAAQNVVQIIGGDTGQYLDVFDPLNHNPTTANVRLRADGNSYFIESKSAYDAGKCIAGDCGGKLGIGTTTPEAAFTLHLKNTSTLADNPVEKIFRIINDGGGDAGISFGVETDTSPVTLTEPTEFAIGIDRDGPDTSVITDDYMFKITHGKTFGPQCKYGVNKGKSCSSSATCKVCMGTCVSTSTAIANGNENVGDPCYDDSHCFDYTLENKVKNPDMELAASTTTSYGKWIANPNINDVTVSLDTSQVHQGNTSFKVERTAAGSSSAYARIVQSLHATTGIGALVDPDGIVISQGSTVYASGWIKAVGSAVGQSPHLTLWETGGSKRCTGTTTACTAQCTGTTTACTTNGDCIAPAVCDASSSDCIAPAVCNASESSASKSFVATGDWQKIEISGSIKQNDRTSLQVYFGLGTSTVAGDIIYVDDVYVGNTAEQGKCDNTNTVCETASNNCNGYCKSGIDIGNVCTLDSECDGSFCVAGVTCITTASSTSLVSCNKSGGTNFGEDCSVSNVCNGDLVCSAGPDLGCNLLADKLTIDSTGQMTLSGLDPTDYVFSVVASGLACNPNRVCNSSGLCETEEYTTCTADEDCQSGTCLGSTFCDPLVSSTTCSYDSDCTSADCGVGSTCQAIRNFSAASVNNLVDNEQAIVPENGICEDNGGSNDGNSCQIDNQCDIGKCRKSGIGCHADSECDPGRCTTNVTCTVAASTNTTSCAPDTETNLKASDTITVTTHSFHDSDIVELQGTCSTATSTTCEKDADCPTDETCQVPEGLELETNYFIVNSTPTSFQLMYTAGDDETSGEIVDITGLTACSGLVINLPQYNCGDVGPGVCKEDLTCEGLSCRTDSDCDVNNTDNFVSACVAPENSGWVVEKAETCGDKRYIADVNIGTDTITLGSCAGTPSYIAGDCAAGSCGGCVTKDSCTAARSSGACTWSDGHDWSAGVPVKFNGIITGLDSGNLYYACSVDKVAGTLKLGTDSACTLALLKTLSGDSPCTDGNCNSTRLTRDFLAECIDTANNVPESLNVCVGSAVQGFYNANKQTIAYMGITEKGNFAIAATPDLTLNPWFHIQGSTQHDTGFVGLGTTFPKSQLDVRGNVTTDGLYIRGECLGVLDTSLDSPFGGVCSTAGTACTNDDDCPGEETCVFPNYDLAALGQCGAAKDCSGCTSKDTCTTASSFDKHCSGPTNGLTNFDKPCTVNAGDCSGAGNTCVDKHSCKDLIPLEVKKIFETKCQGCHSLGSGGLNLDGTDDGHNLINVHPNCGLSESPYIVPGDPDNSFLYQKITGLQLGCGGTMPPVGWPALTGVELTAIETWITSLVGFSDESCETGCTWGAGKGRLGIGTNKPEAALDVEGDAIFRGQLNFSNPAAGSLAQLRQDSDALHIHTTSSQIHLVPDLDQGHNPYVTVQIAKRCTGDFTACPSDTCGEGSGTCKEFAEIVTTTDGTLGTLDDRVNAVIADKLNIKEGIEANFLCSIGTTGEPCSRDAECDTTVGSADGVCSSQFSIEASAYEQWIALTFGSCTNPLYSVNSTCESAGETFSQSGSNIDGGTIEFKLAGESTTCDFTCTDCDPIEAIDSIVSSCSPVFSILGWTLTNIGQYLVFTATTVGDKSGDYSIDTPDSGSSNIVWFNGAGTPLFGEEVDGGSSTNAIVIGDVSALRFKNADMQACSADGATSKGFLGTNSDGDIICDTSDTIGALNTRLLSNIDQFNKYRLGASDDSPAGVITVDDTGFVVIDHSAGNGIQVGIGVGNANNTFQFAMGGFQEVIGSSYSLGELLIVSNGAATDRGGILSIGREAGVINAADHLGSIYFISDDSSLCSSGESSPYTCVENDGDGGDKQRMAMIETIAKHSITNTVAVAGMEFILRGEESAGGARDALHTVLILDGEGPAGQGLIDAVTIEGNLQVNGTVTSTSGGVTSTLAGGVYNFGWNEVPTSARRWVSPSGITDVPVPDSGTGGTTCAGCGRLETAISPHTDIVVKELCCSCGIPTGDNGTDGTEACGINLSTNNTSPTDEGNGYTSLPTGGTSISGNLIIDISELTTNTGIGAGKRKVHRCVSLSGGNATLVSTDWFSARLTNDGSSGTCNLGDCRCTLTYE